MKKVLIMLIISVMVLSIIPTVFSTEIIKSGICGENLTWTLDSEGTLTISGTGEMDDIDYGRMVLLNLRAPWHDYRFDIKAIVINAGVTSLGDHTFYCCTNLISVKISSSVVRIGNSTFGSCTGLTSIEIPDSVTTIDSFAFQDCTSLTSVEIPSSVTSIGTSAFGFCPALSAINVSADNTAYVSIDGVLFNKNQNTIVAFPGGRSGEYKIPSSVTTIDNSAFSNCICLTDIEIPSNVTTIDEFAFYCCKSLTGITIPSSVTSIGDYAFDNCTSLTDVYYQGSEEDWNNISIGEDNECLTNAKVHFMPIKVIFMGEELSFDRPPIIANGRTLVPLRAIFEELGAEVQWDGESKTITAVKDNVTIALTIGKAQMLKNGEPIDLDIAPIITYDRTLVPFRAVAEAFDCKVSWNEETRTVVIE